MSAIEVMTFEEMNRAFDSEWILVGNPDLSAMLEVRSGRVLCHSKDRDEVYREARELRPEHSAILYTGKFEAGTAVVL